MNERFALDTSAVTDYLRAYRPEPPHLATAAELFLPLPVLGELYLGAFGSARREENVSAVEQTTLAWKLLIPDKDTAQLYGKIRREVSPSRFRLSTHRACPPKRPSDRGPLPPASASASD